MPDQSTTIEALKRLRAHLPAEEAEYVERAAPGDERGWSWPARLELLVAAEQRPRILLHGPIGVGKTTELRRWARMLGDRAVRVEVRPSDNPWDALVGVWRTLFKGPLPIGADAESALAWGWLGDGEEAVDVLASQAPALWAHLWAQKPDAILLIDGLDLVPPERVRDFFGPGTPLAMPGLPPVVYVAPHALVTVNAVDERDAAFDPVHIAPFPVVREDGTPDDAVCDWLMNGLLARLRGLDLPIDPDLKRYIGLCSGGIPRDAVRILRTAILASAGKPTVDLRAVYEGSRELRQDLEQSLTPDEIDQLASPLLRPTESLIRKNVVLVYEGAEARYRLPHPVLQRTRKP